MERESNRTRYYAHKATVINLVRNLTRKPVRATFPLVRYQTVDALLQTPWYRESDTILV